MFHGVYTAIVTPWQGGTLDVKKLEELVAHQIEAGVQGVVVCGTTGESLSLSPTDQTHLVQIAADVCKGKIRVMAATGSISTEETILQTNAAQKAGADSALLISPWYTRPTQDNLYHHFKAVHDQTDLPLMLYNNPARTGGDINVDTVIRLAQLPRIQGLKDGAPCLGRIAKLRTALGPDFPLMECLDDRLAAYLAMEGTGVVCVASNVVPDLYVQLMNAWNENDLATFKSIWHRLTPLLSALGLEPNPGPIKYAVHLVHGIKDEYALSYVSLTPATKQAIQKALQDLGVWAP